jgi:hypothetical protein
MLVVRVVSFKKVEPGKNTSPLDPEIGLELVLIPRITAHNTLRWL